MASLLVTGGAGFIGTNFVRHWRLAHPGDAILVLDAVTYAGNPDYIADLDGVDFVHGDICDTALVSRLIADRDCDTIVHFAAETHVDHSIADPDVFVATNIVGTHSLLKAAKALWLDRGSGRPHRFHHVSTDEVFGSLDADQPPSIEGSPLAPNSPYSASKAASDHLVRAYNRTFGLATTTSHCSNNYGPFQFPDKLIPLFLLNALNGHELPIYGDGLNIRDWLFVEDHCVGIGQVLAGGRPGQSYNLGGGQQLPNIAVVDALCAAVDRAFADDPALAGRFPDAPAARGQPTSGLKRFVADRQGHDRRYALDDRRARRELGYQPEHDFAAGLEATMGWYLANQTWWAPRLGAPVQQ